VTRYLGVITVHWKNIPHLVRRQVRFGMTYWMSLR